MPQHAAAQRQAVLRLENLKLQRTSDIVADLLLAKIIRSDFPPGTLLPPDRDLAAQLNVGLSTVHDALRNLEFYGVINLKPGPKGGAIVVRPDRDHLVKSLSLILQLEKATLRELLEARRLMEPSCARLAAERAQPSALEALRENIVRMEQTHDLSEHLDLNVAFHVGLATAGGNRVIDALVGSLRDIIFDCTSALELPMEIRRDTAAAHRGIIEAIEAKDSDQAQRRMDRHLAAFEKFLIDRLGNLDRRLLPSDGYVIAG